MPKIVGVRFRNVAKSYYFDPKDTEFSIGDKVVVETAKGTEMGEVTIPPLEMEEEKVKRPLKPILRKADETDMERMAENLQGEREAFVICKDKIAKHDLPMKLIAAEYSFDRSKLLFYFSAEGRVDFRLLVKDLAGVFRTRIELRQVGVRDETKILGGIGICGRELCCKSYLRDFNPVSIKMAKVQNLSLNPQKISGVCGRLMCCLNNEQDTYEYLNKTLPRSGDYATDIDGRVGVIRSVNILKGTVVVLFEENDIREMKEFPATDLGITKKRDGRPAPGENIPENADEIRERVESEKMKAISGLSKWDVSTDGLKHTDGSKGSDKGDRSERSDRGNRGRNRRRNKKNSGGRNAGNNAGDGKNTSANAGGSTRGPGGKGGGKGAGKESGNESQASRKGSRGKGRGRNNRGNRKNNNNSNNNNNNSKNQNQGSRGKGKSAKPKSNSAANDIQSNNTGGYTSNYGRRRDKE